MVHNDKVKKWGMVMNKKVLSICYLLLMAASSHAQPVRPTFQAPILVPHVPEADKGDRRRPYVRQLGNQGRSSLESSQNDGDRNETSIINEDLYPDSLAASSISFPDPSLHLSGRASYMTMGGEDATIDGEAISSRTSINEEVFENMQEALHKYDLRPRILTGSLEVLSGEVIEKQQKLLHLMDGISSLRSQINSRSVSADLLTEEVNKLYDQFFEIFSDARLGALKK